MSSPDPFWTAMGKVRALKDVPHAWRQRFSKHIDRALPYLRATRDLARQHPCLAPCGMKCSMRVSDGRNGLIASCPENPPQAEAVALADEDAIVRELDMPGICKAVATALSIKSVPPSPAASHTWHIGSVALPPGRELPVYLSLPMGRRTYAEVARTILVRGRSACVLLIPGTVDDETRTLVEDNGGSVLSLSTVAHGVPGANGSNLKPLASILGAAVAAPEPEYMFLREGKNWRVRWAGGPVNSFPDTKGFRYYLILLENPYVPYLALELRQLEGRVPEMPRPGRAIEIAGDTDVQMWRQKITEAEADLAQAQKNNDLGRIDRLSEELEALKEHVRVAFGLNGRPRMDSDEAEKARKNVSAALKVVRENLISEDMDEMAAYLESSAPAGKTLIYRPPQSIHWNM